MNSIERPPGYPRIAGRPPEDVDELLRTFFRSEVPRSWPTLALPARDDRGNSPPVSRPRLRLHRRFGVAAAVGLLVVGYLSLAGRFPVETNDPGATVNPARTLAAKELDRLRKRTTQGGALRSHQVPVRSGEAVEPTRNGGEALLQWEQLPGGLFMRIDEKRPPQR